MRCLYAVILAGLLAACAATAPAPQPGDDVDVVLLGEQHDAAEHQRLHRQMIEALAARDQLAAVVIEMADQPGTTRGLPREADDAQARAALGWKDEAWPWARYGPAVMAAVRAGVPVIGANLPRDAMRAAMADATFDARLPPDALQRQQQAVREGHCGLLPEAQIAPMTRVQIARDVAMAQQLSAQARPGKTVVLLAGAGHVDVGIGVPRHLPPQLRAQALTLPAQETGRDGCDALRRQMQRAPSAR